MGVAGAGKSLVGAALARALALQFVEGDSFHPPANLQRMAAGIPLTDHDRQPWLQSLAAELDAAQRAGTGLVLSCSALKRRYRDTLRGPARAVQFIMLRGDRALLAQRLAERHGHFMSPALLDSQLATLEEPAADEGAWVCDIRETPDIIVRGLVARMVAAQST